MLLTDTPYNEQELLVQVAAGDERAFTVLVERYHANIYTTALRLVHHKELAEEVLQDVFLKVWLQRSQLPALESFPAWLHRVAKNTIYTAFRHSLKNAVVLGGDADAMEELAPFWDDQRLIDKEFNQLVHQAVAQLPTRQQQTWRLIHEEGKKRKEAATAMGISPETVKYNLEEATRKVRTYCLSRLPVAVLLLISSLK